MIYELLQILKFNIMKKNPMLLACLFPFPSFRDSLFR